MTEEPTAQSAELESPPHSPESNPPHAAAIARNVWAARVTAHPPPAAAPRRRPRWKKILVPTLLAVLGVGLVVAAYFLYPRRAPLGGVTGATVQVVGSSPYVNDHMQQFSYYVSQTRPGVARVEIQVELFGRHFVPETAIPIPRGAYARILFDAGAKMLHCSPHCFHRGTYGDAYPRFQPYLPPTATAVFYVRARSYEVAANGATAAVGFPELDYTGTRQAELELEYQNFPSASSYDWSSFPGGYFSKSVGADWIETALPSHSQLFTSGGISARVVTGVSSTAQQRDSNFTLAAGVLFGVGGSALVAAVQEALHD